MSFNPDSTPVRPLDAIAGPTPDDLTRLARRLQAEALQHADTLAANRGVVNGAMFEITHLLSAAVLDGGIVAGPARCEMLLKFVRQIERTCKVVNEIESHQNADRDAKSKAAEPRGPSASE